MSLPRVGFAAEAENLAAQRHHKPPRPRLCGGEGRAEGVSGKALKLDDQSICGDDQLASILIANRRKFLRVERCFKRIEMRQ